MRIYSENATIQESYFDALGFSWDGYGAGDNQHIGNFCSSVKPTPVIQTVGAVKVIYQNNASVTKERTTVGGMLNVYQFPSIPTSALATTKATTLLADTNKNLLQIKCVCDDKGPFVAGMSIPFLFTEDSDLETALATLATYFIIATGYDEELARSTLTLMDSRQIARGRLTVAILDDKITQIPYVPRIFNEMATPDDPSEDTAILYVDTAGDFHIKINHGGTTKDITLVDWSAA